MLKYLFIFIAFIITGIGINFFITKNDASISTNSHEIPLPAIDGKSKKLNALENDILSQVMTGFKAHRNGPNLVITTSSGKESIFQDVDTDFESELYYLVEYRKNPEVLVIFQEDLEGTSFKYLLPDGSEIPANHYLFASPSGNRAVQINVTKNENDFNGWLVLEKEGQGFKKVAEQSPPEFRDFVNVGLQFKAWTDENSIEAVAKYSTTQKAEFVTLCAPAKIEIIEGKWTLDIETASAEQDCSEFNMSAAPDYIQDLL
jgi:hypothetical protein